MSWLSNGNGCFTDRDTTLGTVEIFNKKGKKVFSGPYKDIPLQGSVNGIEYDRISMSILEEYGGPYYPKNYSPSSEKKWKYGNGVVYTYKIIYPKPPKKRFI